MQKTLLIIKPDSFARGDVGGIIKRIEQEGFTICPMVEEALTRERASEFYKEHAGKEFFERLVSFMVSGLSLGIELEHKHAICKLRELNGNTDPSRAAEGTLRRLYGDGGAANAVHGSDSPESSERKRLFFFGDAVWPSILISNPSLKNAFAWSAG